MGIQQGQRQHLLPTAGIGAACGLVVWLVAIGTWRIVAGAVGGIVGGFFLGWAAMAAWANLIRQPDPYGTFDTLLGDLAVFVSTWVMGSLAGIGVGVLLEVRHRRAH